MDNLCTTCKNKWERTEENDCTCNTVVAVDDKNVVTELLNCKTNNNNNRYITNRDDYGIRMTLKRGIVGLGVQNYWSIIVSFWNFDIFKL